MKAYMYYTVDLNLLGEVDVEIHYNYTPGRQAYISGLPENCYPAESCEIEIESVRCDLLSPKGCAELASILQDNDRCLDAIDEDATERYEEAA